MRYMLVLIAEFLENIGMISSALMWKWCHWKVGFQNKWNLELPLPFFFCLLIRGMSRSQVK